MIYGHSLGGSIASRLVPKIEKENSLRDLHKKILGIVLEDIVEGSALNSISLMKQMILKRPKYFNSLENSVEYYLSQNIVKNKESLIKSIPS